jgi:hypothetical protein
MPHSTFGISRPSWLQRSTLVDTAPESALVTVPAPIPVCVGPGSPAPGAG